MGKIELKFKGKLPMCIEYNEVLNRLVAERKRLGLTQKEIAYLIHITQSNYSKIEKGLHRLTYEELKSLSKLKIDILYIFTGYRCSGKYSEYFTEFICCELINYLGIIYSLLTIIDSKTNANGRKDFLKKSRYLPFVLCNTKNANIFCIIRFVTNNRQKAMADNLGVDIKKFRELEKGRSLPDSEIIWKLYFMYNVSPAIILNDKNSMIREISLLLEEIEEDGVEAMNIINLI